MSLSIGGLYRFDEFELNPARRILARNGTPVSISPRAFEVLTYLVANSGRVVTKDELLKAVWRPVARKNPPRRIQLKLVKSIQATDRE